MDAAIDYETMIETSKENLEDFQDLLFLKRLLEQSIETDSIFELPIRYRV